jgi:hypothetical protein
METPIGTGRPDLGGELWPRGVGRAPPPPSAHHRTRTRPLDTTDRREFKNQQRPWSQRPPLLTGRSGNEAFLPSAAEPQPRLYESANRGGLRRERSAISSQRSAFGEKAHFTSIAVKSPNKPAKRCALPSPIAQSRRVSLTQLYLLHRESEVFRALQRKDSEVSTFNRRPLQRHHSTNFLPKRGEVTDEDSMSGAPV